MDYAFLKPEEQARILQQKLHSAEREHFTQSIGSPDGTPYDAQYLKDAEDRITSLRAQLAEVDAAK